MQPCHLQQSCPLRKTTKRNESVRHPAPYFEGEVVILISKPCLPSKSKAEAEETHRSLWWFLFMNTNFIFLPSLMDFLWGTISPDAGYSSCQKSPFHFRENIWKISNFMIMRTGVPLLSREKKFLRVLTQMENWSNSSTQQQLYYTTTPLPLYIPFWYMATIKTWQSSSM